MSNKNKKQTSIVLVSIVFLMSCLAFSSVPLYRIFCQKTGYGGTPRVGFKVGSHIHEREFVIEFNADVNKELDWSFVPLQRSMKVKAGENALAFYRVKNHSRNPVVGWATYNVTPDKAAPYFYKIYCFCFDAQRLEPGQEIDMPVSFTVDADIIKDHSLSQLKTITLSYTFFLYKGQEAPKSK